MKRRQAIKSLLIVTGGIIVIPSCLQEGSKNTIPLNHLKITPDQEKLLAELAETIIPATNTPGAKDTYAHAFALKMIDDCHDKADQQTFMKGLKQVDQLAKDRFNTSFVKSTPAQREQLVTELEKRAAANNKDDLATFYQMTKSRVIQGYMGSKYVLGQVQKLELVPGRYNGAAPVKPTTNKA